LPQLYADSKLVFHKPVRIGDQDSDSPLRRLKMRSPASRWLELKKTWKESRLNERSTDQSISGEIGVDSGSDTLPLPARTKRPPISEEAGGFEDSIPDFYPIPHIATLEEKTKQDGKHQYSDPVRDPKMLKKVTNILPYFDYEPDEDFWKKDSCVNLCPRSASGHCKKYTTGTTPECPEEMILGDKAYEGRVIGESLFQWEAPDLYHNPLYFEDVGLERYGHTHHPVLQPFVSARKFSVQLLGLPYQMTIDPIRKKIYSLGWYRPGECAPHKYYQIPWNTEAAIREAVVWTSLFFIFP